MVRFGPYEARPATRELFRHGTRVKLPPQAFEVLRVLLERRGELITRQEFHRVLWPTDTFVDFDQGLNNAIKRIREVLNDSAESPRYVETLPRLGYRFIGTVEAAEAEPAHPHLTSEAVLESASAVPEIEASPANQLQTETAVSSVGSHRKLTAGVLLTAAAVIGWLAGVWAFRPGSRAPRITGEVQLTADGTEKGGALVTDGRRIYFTATVNGQQTIVAVPTSGGQAVPLKLPFTHTSVYDISPDKNDLLVADGASLYQDSQLWRVPIVGGTPRRLGNVVAHDAAWSSDGKKLAYVVGNGVYLANADGSDPHTLVAPRAVPDEWAWRPTWSPDGQRLRFDYYNMQTHGAHIWEVSADASNAHAVFAAMPDCPMQAYGTWTPDGRYYVFTCWKDLESGVPWPASNLWAVREKSDLFHKTQAGPESLTVGPARQFAYTLSPDGKTIFAVVSIKHGELMRYDARTHAFSLYSSGLSAESVSFSPDGKWVAYVKYPQGELWRSRADGSEPLQLSSRPLFASTPAWSPDGSQIAFNGAEAGETSRVYLVPAGGGEPRRIDNIGLSVDPTWSPDGGSLVYLSFASNDSLIETLNLKTGTMAPVAGSKGFWAPKMSPDGRWIVALSNDLRKLMLFDSKTQAWKEIARGDPFDWPHWSHDSRSIYFARRGSDLEILRVGVQGGTPEEIVDLKNLRTTGADSAWFSLTPDGDVLLLHDTGSSSEIFALSFDAP